MGLSLTKIDWNEEASLREKLYFGVILVLIVVAMMRLLWLPTIDVIKKKKMDMVNVKLQILTLKKFIDIDKKIAPSKPVLQKEAADKNVEKVLSSMAGDSRTVISEVIREITSRRLMGSVVLNGLTFGTAVAKGGYTSVPVSLSVFGTFSSLQNYLTMMEKLNYLFTVDNVKYKLSEAHAGLLLADLEASIYVGGGQIEK